MKKLKNIASCFAILVILSGCTANQNPMDSLSSTEKKYSCKNLANAITGNEKEIAIHSSARNKIMGAGIATVLLTAALSGGTMAAGFGPSNQLHAKIRQLKTKNKGFYMLAKEKSCKNIAQPKTNTATE